MSSGRAVVVTGAGGVIGRAISAHLAARADSVVLVGRRPRALEASAAALPSGVSVRIHPADVRDVAAVAAIARAVAELGARRIVLVNGAGIVGPINRVELTDPAEWQDTIAVNLVGPYLLTRALLPIMRKEQWGRVINVSSAQTLHGPDPVMSAYATAKMGLNLFTACLAADFAETEISACAVHPGDVETAMAEEIRRRAARAGESAAHLVAWGAKIAAGGGDEPEEAGRLAAEIVDRPAAWSNGRFLRVPSSRERHPDTHWAMPVV